MPAPDFMRGVVWTDLPDADASPGDLYATHEGIFEFGGAKIRCYRLNNGQAIFRKEDFEAFLSDWLGQGKAA